MRKTLLFIFVTIMLSSCRSALDKTFVELSIKSKIPSTVSIVKVHDAFNNWDYYAAVDTSYKIHRFKVDWNSVTEMKDTE